MKRSVALTCLTAVLLATGAIAPAYAQDRKSQLEGSKPYTPTRLEWLAVDLNAQMRSDMTAEDGYNLVFVAIEKEDAILIYVTHLSSVNRRIMNGAVDTARKIISIEAKSKGWSSWLKVKERIEIAESK